METLVRRVERQLTIQNDHPEFELERLLYANIAVA